MLFVPNQVRPRRHFVPHGFCARFLLQPLQPMIFFATWALQEDKGWTKASVNRVSQLLQSIANKTIGTFEEMCTVDASRCIARSQKRRHPDSTFKHAFMNPSRRQTPLRIGSWPKPKNTKDWCQHPSQDIQGVCSIQ